MLLSYSPPPLPPPLHCRPWESRARWMQRRRPQLRLSGRRWLAACTRCRRRRGQTPSRPPAAWWASRCARCCARAWQGWACLLAACLLEGGCCWRWCCGVRWVACCWQPPAPSALLPAPHRRFACFLNAIIALGIALCLPARARLPATSAQVCQVSGLIINNEESRLVDHHSGRNFK